MSPRVERGRRRVYSVIDVRFGRKGDPFRHPSCRRVEDVARPPPSESYGLPSIQCLTRSGVAGSATGTILAF